MRTQRRPRAPITERRPRNAMTDSTDPELPTDNSELRERTLSRDPLDPRRFSMGSE